MAQIYTYSQFATDVIAIMKNELVPTDDLREKIIAKADDLLVQQIRKAEYAKNNPSKSKAKGASEKTKNLAEQIKGILNSNPKTSAEIAAELKLDLNPLQIANAAKYIDGVITSKEVRPFVGKNGLRAEKYYTAYALV